MGAFDKAGNVDTICIFLGDVDPTAEKLYRSDHVIYSCTSSIVTFVIRYIWVVGSMSRVFVGNLYFVDLTVTNTMILSSHLSSFHLTGWVYCVCIIHISSLH